MLPNKVLPVTVVASPNRVGGADGGTDQHGRAARGVGGGGGSLPVGRAGWQGAHSRRAVCDDARTLGTTPLDRVDVAGCEPRATHRKPKRRYKMRVRLPSKLDPHLDTIGEWLAAEPDITALTIVRRLAEIDPNTF